MFKGKAENSRRGATQEELAEMRSRGRGSPKTTRKGNRVVKNRGRKRTVRRGSTVSRKR